MPNPLMPAELAQIIEIHRGLYGGFVMMADADPAPGGSADTPTPAAPATPAEDDGKGGKQAILADLAKERDQRQLLQKQLDDLKPFQDQMKKLTDALGVPKGKTTDDIVGQLQTEMADLRHDNLVSKLARTHGITSDDDVELLRTVRDPAHMEKLAARLGAQSSAGDPAGTPPASPGTPQPDPSAGRTPGTASPRSLSEAIAAHYDNK